MRSVFFFKQKTAYEMRISDWSSDVCSSDLLVLGGVAVLVWLRNPQHRILIILRTLDQHHDLKYAPKHRAFVAEGRHADFLHLLIILKRLDPLSPLASCHPQRVRGNYDDKIGRAHV